MKKYNYTLNDLTRYRDAVLLRMRLENIFSKRHFFFSPVEIENVLLKKTPPLLYSLEIDFLFIYYKSYLPNLTRKELIKNLGLYEIQP